MIRKRERDIEARLVARIEGACMGGGGSSSSSSNSSQTTNTTDKRQVVDGSSVGVSSDSSTVNVNVTDQGAFANAVDLAKSNNAAFSQTLVEVLGLAKDSLKATNTAASSVGDAYKVATDTISGNRALVAGALAVAGIVAIKVFK